MAKSRRKASGAVAGKFKIKRMGKGWSAHQTPYTPVKVRNKAQREALAKAEAEGTAGTGKNAPKKD